MFQEKLVLGKEETSSEIVTSNNNGAQNLGMEFYSNEKIKWRAPELESVFELDGMHFSGKL